MSTNYYLIPNHENWQVKRNKFIAQITNLVSLNSAVVNKTEVEEITKQFLAETRIHLGKKSYGWNFGINANGFKYFNNKKTFQEFIRTGEIINEYGEKLSVQQFEDICFLNNNSSNMTHTKYSELNVSVIDNLEFLNHGEFS